MKSEIKIFELKDSSLPVGKQKIMFGTLFQIRKYLKNFWKHDNDIAIEHSNCFNEEDFYYYLDNDKNLSNFISSIGYYLAERCDVTLDDFGGDKPSQELIDEVLVEIKNDISKGDLTALEELINFIPINYLKGYLPEKLI